MALVEIGASAGLNLLFDHYLYFIDGHDTVSPFSSQVVISRELRSPASGSPFLGTAPRITTRLGIDQHPINVADPDDVTPT